MLCQFLWTILYSRTINTVLNCADVLSYLAASEDFTCSSFYLEIFSNFSAMYPRSVFDHNLINNLISNLIM